MTKIETKKTDIRESLKKVKIFSLKIGAIGKKTWFFTIVFFLVTFGFSLWIWWSCIFNPSPSEQVISDIQKEQKEFETKERRVELTIKKIQERNFRFQEAVNHQLDRKIFKSGAEIFQEMNPSPSPTSGAGINKIP